MIKTPPSAGRVAAMVLFALSCFSILLFLWVRFGGAIPLGAEGYRFQVAFGEAVHLTAPVDVRAAGITIGKVRETELEERTGRTLATIELDSRYAPIRRDARAILRIKTLLGETFVEITTGTRGAPPLADGGRLADAQVAPTVELDEVTSTFDPRTRRAFRVWQRELAAAVGARGPDLNAALGHLPAFTGSASQLLGVLDRQEAALRGVVRDTGEVYGALTRDERQLRRLVEGSHGVFRQTAAEREALAEAIRIFPTFLDESRATAVRLEEFSRGARPLVRDLRPAMRELRPAVRSLRALAPDARTFFSNLDRQIAVSREGLPALRSLLDSTRPMLGATVPFLEELNPILEWFELNQLQLADFLSAGSYSMSATTPAHGPDEVGHYIRILNVSGLESIAIHQERLPSNRGNSYLSPLVVTPRALQTGIFPNWDCNHIGGERERVDGTGGAPACFTEPNISFQGRQQGRFPHVEKEEYGD